MYKMHLEMKELYKHDEDSEWYFLIAMYRNQYFKTIFIITSTLLEAYSIISLLFHEIIPKSDIILENVDNFEIKLNICTEENIMEYEELSHFSWFNLTAPNRILKCLYNTEFCSRDCINEVNNNRIEI